MPAPLEIFAAPFTAYLGATANTVVAEPTDLNAAVPGTWTKIGTRGSDGYDEDGVTFSHEETIEYFRGLGKTGRLKAWRTEEEPSVSFKVYDLTPDALAIAQGQTKSTVAASGGVTAAQKVTLLKGYDVQQRSLLLRSDAGSPLGDSFKTQLWFPTVVLESVDEIVFKKGEPAGLEFTFAILQDNTSGFGQFNAQSA